MAGRAEEVSYASRSGPADRNLGGHEASRRRQVAAGDRRRPELREGRGAPRQRELPRVGFHRVPRNAPDLRGADARGAPDHLDPDQRQRVRRDADQELSGRVRPRAAARYVHGRQTQPALGGDLRRDRRGDGAAGGRCCCTNAAPSPTNSCSTRSRPSLAGAGFLCGSIGTCASGWIGRARFPTASNGRWP